MGIENVCQVGWKRFQYTICNYELSYLIRKHTSNVCFVENWFKLEIRQCRGGSFVHTKKTVKYICEVYPSGSAYYYKQEMITHDNWGNIHSLQWSRPRPISEKTFIKRKKEGYKVEVKKIKKPPAEVIEMSHFLKRERT